MMVLFGPTPRSIITAYLASRVHGARPVLRDPSRQFFFDETMDVDDVDYDSLYREFKDRYGGMDFLEDEKLYEIVEDEVFWASRYRTPDRYNLILTVLSQIERDGTKAYLAQRTPEAKEMKDRIRRVTGEFRRAKGYIAFEEDRKNKVLMAKASLEHDIEDLVLRHFAKRRPGHTIAILDEESAHLCLGDDILIDSRSRFPEDLSRKDTGRYWALLSDAKRRESKKDARYTATQLPGNYWKWVGEGSSDEVRQPRVTLDDFTTD